jgi:hypothetical protein
MGRISSQVIALNRATGFSFSGSAGALRAGLSKERIREAIPSPSHRHWAELTRPWIGESLR